MPIVKRFLKTRLYESKKRTTAVVFFLINRIFDCLFYDFSARFAVFSFAFLRVLNVNFAVFFVFFCGFLANICGDFVVFYDQIGCFESPIISRCPTRRPSRRS